MDQWAYLYLNESNSNAKRFAIRTEIATITHQSKMLNTTLLEHILIHQYHYLLFIKCIGVQCALYTNTGEVCCKRFKLLLKNTYTHIINKKFKHYTIDMLIISDAY